MTKPTTQQQWDHAKFETLNAFERISKQDVESPATHLAAILTTTIHAVYSMAPSPDDADKLIKECIEWAWMDHVAELEPEA